MKLSDCNGCREDFYNGKNDLGVKLCWSFDAEKPLVRRFRLHIDTPMNRRNGYFSVRVPPCFTMKGYVHVDQIPDYAQFDRGVIL